MCHAQFTSKTVDYKWLQIHENHIYVNCDRRNEYKSDPRRYEYYWTSTENKNWKKTQARTRFEPRGHGRSWEIMGSNPVRAWIFFQALFSLLVQ